MTAQELITAYGQLLVGFEKKLLPIGDEACGLKVDPQRYTDHAKVWEAVSAFNASAGWLGFQSENRYFTSVSVPGRSKDSGQLLHAEMVNAQGASLHIRYVGPHWLLTTYTPEQGDAYVTDERQHLSRAESGPALCYRRYWRLDGAQGPVVAFCCFIGFAQTGK